MKILKRFKKVDRTLFIREVGEERKRQVAANKTLDSGIFYTEKGSTTNPNDAACYTDMVHIMFSNNDYNIHDTHEDLLLTIINSRHATSFKITVNKVDLSIHTNQFVKYLRQGIDLTLSYEMAIL